MWVSIEQISRSMITESKNLCVFNVYFQIAFMEGGINLHSIISMWGCLLFPNHGRHSTSPDLVHVGLCQLKRWRQYLIAASV